MPSGQYRKATIFNAWRVNRREPTPDWIKDRIGELPDTVPEGRWMVASQHGELGQWDDEVFHSVFVPAN